MSYNKCTAINFTFRTAARTTVVENESTLINRKNGGYEWTIQTGQTGGDADVYFPSVHNYDRK